MTKVFIAGSITIKNLSEEFLIRINNIVDKGLTVLVGDAGGVDLSVQEYLKNLSAENVIVYCSGYVPRNNVNSWPVVAVKVDAKEGTRAFFTAKDKEMAAVADFGLMVWDKKSTGTLSNVIEMIKDRKMVAVYLNKDGVFFDVKTPDDLEILVSKMSDGARELAEKKISLSSKLNSVRSVQLGLGL
ncbi:hypothetical protein ACIQTU_13260 [Brevundimonas sp. NPDC090276]|uniref:hypothetical protein n=1 Tax=Brevundimonas sp. NPDC090276 TaxID=3363956 RepID=UPI00383B0648